MDRLEGSYSSNDKGLRKKKRQSHGKTDTDDIWVKLKSLQWVLFVIFAIKNGNMVVI